MTTLLKSSNYLTYFERLVLLIKADLWLSFDPTDPDCKDYFDPDCKHYISYGYKPVRCAEVEELIVPFAKGMTKLVCLGIVGFPIDLGASHITVN